jgi:hypothetical protein
MNLKACLSQLHYSESCGRAGTPGGPAPPHAAGRSRGRDRDIGAALGASTAG